MMNFITGGTGLVGAHLILNLLRSDKKVRALKRKHSDLQMVKHIFNYYVSFDESEKLFELIEWVEGDILDVYSLLDMLDGIDTVYHCAAIVSFDPKDRDRMIQDNINGTANIVNACLEREIQLCHVSSIAAVGRDQTHDMITENDQWLYHPKVSAYAISKHESEREVWRGIAEGLQAVIVNPSIILGPGNWESGSSKIFLSVYKGMKFYTDGITGFVDVRDVVKAMILLIEKQEFGDRFILNGDNFAFKELFIEIASAFDVEPPKIHAKRWMTELVWRIEAIKGKLFNTKPLITKETAHTANKQYFFSNEKLKNRVKFEYRSLKTSITEFSEMFLADL